MDTNNLSQEEIEALLEGTDGVNFDTPDISGAQAVDKTPIRENEMGKVIELMNQNLDYQTNQISTIYNRAMNYSNVRAYYTENSEVVSELDGERLIQIHINYTEGLTGENSFVIMVKDAILFAEVISNTKQSDLNENVLNSLSEGLLQMMAASNTYFGQRLNRIVNTSKPQIEILDSSDGLRFPPGKQCIHVSFTLNPDNAAPIHLHQISSIPLGKELINIQKLAESGDLYGSVSAGGPSDKQPTKESVNVRPVLFSQLELRDHKEHSGKINLLLDINMQLTVELGRTKKSIRQILSWGEGSVVDLTTAAGEPSYLFVNGKLVAKGEIQVMPGDDTFGIRLTEIISSKERI